ncbi:peptidylprolyl isomerase [Pseudopelagicola sp. nBUS_20]|uniref:peptidylprolyl isomerase n=1 Tax=Pseudopelagicola sp. nBUS_20 TaxID=3395317 RepID=UPI003EB87B3A
MSKQLKLLRNVSLALMLATPSLAQDTPDIRAVVAFVNGQEITLGEMIATRDALPKEYQSLPPDVLYNGILDQLIQQSALSQELQSIPQRIEILLKNERRSLLAVQALQNLAREFSPSEADVQTAYNARLEAFKDTPEFNASHILVETEGEASTILEDIKAGADFGETAEVRSTGPSGPSGGQLGWFGLGDMVQPFEEALVSMSTGDVSNPVQTQFGWHLIKLNDKRTKPAPTLEDLSAELIAELQAGAVDLYVNQLTEAADIDRSGAEKFDPTVIQRSELLDAENSNLPPVNTKK